MVSMARLNARYLETKNQNLRLREEFEALKQAEAIAMQTESRYGLLATHGTDVIWTLSRELEFQFLCPSIESLTGYTVAEVMAMPLQDLFSRSPTNGSWHRSPTVTRPISTSPTTTSFR